MSAGSRLREAMELRGYTRRMLADQAGISYSTVSHFVNDTRDMHLDDMKKVSNVLGVKASWLAWGVR